MIGGIKKYNMVLIAEFRDGFYQGGFGFTVEVYKNDLEEFVVLSNGLLKDKYESFELFLEDLIKHNPLWYTYYYVSINGKYNDLISKKIEESVEYIIDSLSRLNQSNMENWRINNTQTKLSENLKGKLEVLDKLKF